MDVAEENARRYWGGTPTDNTVTWAEGNSNWIASAITDSGIAVVEFVSAYYDNGHLWHTWEVADNDHVRGFDLYPRSYHKFIGELDDPKEERPTLAGSPVEPRIIRWTYSGHKLMHGSANEQHWRRRIKMTDQVVTAAERKARDLLVSMLTPDQRLQFIASGGRWFLQRGKLNKLYLIRKYDGLEIVEPVARRDGLRIVFRVLGTVCYHTNTWLPGEDTMLQQKLMIENDEASLLRTGNITRAAQPWYVGWKVPRSKGSNLRLARRTGKPLNEMIERAIEAKMQRRLDVTT